MKRRELLAVLGGAAAWPFAARAQHRLPTVGVLGVATSSAWQSNLAVFTQRLNELGLSDARTLAFAYRWAEGSSGRFPDLAAELVRLKVDVILTAGGAVPTAKQATTTIPRTLEIRTGQDQALDPHADILYICIDPLTDSEKIVIATSTLTARIPTMGGFRESVQAGSQVFYRTEHGEHVPQSGGAREQNPARHEARRHSGSSRQPNSIC